MGAGMKGKLTVAVTRDRYSTRFNIPKPSRHTIKPTTFVPTHRVSSHIEGVTVLWPTRCDLIHTINRIPILTTKKFVIAFESHLPRYFGGENTRFFKYMRARLASSSCRRIIAWSECAKRIFLATHSGAEEFKALERKLEVIYPNIVLPECGDEPRTEKTPLRLVFVGAHFGRKGGAVAARAAELARHRRIPLHFHIISSLQVGGGIWSDPRDRTFFDPYFKLLQGDNVTFDRSLPNKRVIDALRGADFSILTTLSDTFGFSAVESLAVGTPVIATSQGALPEFVIHGHNGLILPLEVNPQGEWVHAGRPDKDTKAFAEVYRNEIERMAHSLVEAVTACSTPLATMRQNARATAERLFDSRKTSPLLDRLYEESAFGPEI
jgi:glycosyltransferase involved in cell wall biosynthesis